MNRYGHALTAVLLTISVPLHASWWGTSDGRSANPENNPRVSIEGFISDGDNDYQYLGGRLNYTVNESLTLFGDYGNAERVGDGSSVGGGAYFYLPTLSESATFLNDKDVAIKASYHKATLDFDPGGRVSSWEVDVSALSVAFMISPKTVFKPDSGLNWYATAGFTKLEFDRPGRVYVGNEFIRTSASSDSTELHLGAGVYLPLGPGTLYAGADLIEDLIFGVGYRFAIK